MKRFVTKMPREFRGKHMLSLQQYSKLFSTLKFQLVATLIISLSTSSVVFAKSQKVLVMLKSKEALHMTTQNFAQKSQYSLAGVDFSVKLPKTSLARLNTQMVDSLKNINALILEVSNESDLELMAKNSDVLYVEKEVMHPAPKPVAGYKLGAHQPLVNPLAGFKPTPKTPWGILAVKAMEAWSLSSKGSNSRVLVLDTGIDKEHPSLKRNIEKGQDFVGDNQKPYSYADTVGHGSHVAGTIAGVADSAGFVGVAPEAKLLVGRVCSNEGCSNLAVAQGIDWGISEKVDVISMSLGGEWSTPSERMAVKKAEEAGVTIVAASGNDGTPKVGYPAALPTVIAVGATDSQSKKAEFSQYGPELAVVAPGVDVVSAVPQGTGRESQVIVNFNNKTYQVNGVSLDGGQQLSVPLERELVYVGLGKPEEFAAVNVSGKIALAQRGEIKFTEKVQNALKAGAAGIVIYNNVPGLVRGSITEDGSVLNIAVFMIEKEVGESLKLGLLDKKRITLKLATVVTDYSSYDGTSMATPHVSGVVALMKSANKNLKPAQVKELLMKTATPLGPNPNNEYGSGLVNAQAAVQAAANLR